MLITKTDLRDLDTKQSFYEFMDKVHQKLTSWSPAVFIGYNNINFDEKFLPRRGRINCSLNDDGKWRWFGTQFTVKSN